MTASQQQLYLAHEQPPEFNALVVALGGIAPPCRTGDPERWFSPDPQPAMRACGDCHAKVECLAYGRATDQRYGVWGGIDLERRQRHTRTTREAS